MPHHSIKSRFENLNHEKKRLIKQSVIEHCGISKRTFYRWVEGKTSLIPRLSKQYLENQLIIQETK
jgi:predicted DNA-binding transcriptional regulator AlpA